MKKKFPHVFAFLIVLMSLQQLKAQTQFANPSFKQWEKRTFAGFEYSDPSNWYTLNQLQKFGFDQTTIQTTEAHGDSSAVLLNTVSSSFGNIPGLITGMPFLSNSGEPDMNLNYMAFKDKPKSIQFWYKSYPEDGDQNAMYCLLTKWNNSTQTRDTLAEATWATDSTVSIYSLALVPFEYRGNFEPDSMYILFSSSLNGFDPVPGSEFYLDDILFNYVTGTTQLNKLESTQINPNPATQKFQIQAEQYPLQVSIFNVMGQKVYEGILENEQTEIDVQSLAAGLFHVVLVQTETMETTTKMLNKIN